MWVTRMGERRGLGRVIHKNSAERVPEGVWNEEWEQAHLALRVAERFVRGGVATRALCPV